MLRFSNKDSKISKPSKKKLNVKKYIESLQLPSNAYFPPPHLKAQELEKVNTPFEKLLWACRHGEIGIVTEILTQHPELTNHHGIFDTPLGQATLNGHLNVVKVLVENFGANVNAPSMYQTPLYIAATYSDVAIALYLIENGANVTARSSSGTSTPLRKAIEKLCDIQGPKQMALFRLLISHGAMQGESWDEPIYGKTIKDYIRIYITGPNMHFVLETLGLEVEQSVDALCQAFSRMESQSDPRINTLITAFSTNLSLEQQPPSTNIPRI